MEYPKYRVRSEIFLNELVFRAEAKDSLFGGWYSIYAEPSSESSRYRISKKYDNKKSAQQDIDNHHSNLTRLKSEKEQQSKIELINEEYIPRGKS